MTFRTRFAPSPTGPLHLGHAYSALLAFDMAMQEGGDFVLRIEDIDSDRSKPDWEQQIYDDLEWLGLWWETPVLRQSDRLPAYAQALDALWKNDLLYPCNCNRKDIQAALSAPQEGALPGFGIDGLIYPGTCRNRADRPIGNLDPRPDDVALRLVMGLAVEQTQHEVIGDVGTLSFHESGQGPEGHTDWITFDAKDLEIFAGDIVLSRKDFLGSYHLSVVLDDAAQGITHVVRGQDLFEATKIHVLLQRLMRLPTPIYHHHRLIRDASGKRLAKRDDARAISKYRAEGATPEDIRRMVGLSSSAA